MAANIHQQPSPSSNIWTNRTFVAIWIGNAISVIGDGFHNVALGLWVLYTTGSGAAMASVMVISIIINILLGPLAGTFCDRTDRRRLMITMDMLRFLLVLGMAYTMTLPSVATWLIILFTAGISACSVFFGPAFQASLVNIVGKEQVAAATSTLQLTSTLSQVVGPVIGATVITTVGTWSAFSINAVSFLVSGIMILLAGTFPSPRQDAQSRGSFWGDLMGGLAYIKGNQLVTGLSLSVPIINFFAKAALLLVPILAVKVWAVTKVQYGVLESLFIVGASVGALLMMLLSKRIVRRGRWITGGLIAMAIFTVAVMAAPSFLMAVPSLLLVGIFMALVNVIVNAVLQAEVPPELQGRVFGTLGSLSTVASPLSMLIAGTLADVLGAKVISIGTSVLFLLTAVFVALCFPAIRRYQ